MPQRLGRRTFLKAIGRTTLGVVVMGTLAACATTGGEAGRSTATSTPAGPAGEGGAFDWHRVDLGFVSAYIMVRAGRAAIVDTGVEGSADDIERGLAAAGLGWDAVGHVIFTHRHDDHVGSAAAALERAAGATPYAGHADIDAIAAPREVKAVADGDDVFGLQVITTPGHTAGHICVLDAVGGVLVAGDALVGTRGGGVGGPDSRYTEDLDTAHLSVRKLGGYTFETVLFGHGEPVESGADAQVAALAEELVTEP